MRNLTQLTLDRNEILDRIEKTACTMTELREDIREMQEFAKLTGQYQHPMEFRHSEALLRDYERLSIRLHEGMRETLVQIKACKEAKRFSDYFMDAAHGYLSDSLFHRIVDMAVDRAQQA